MASAWMKFLKAYYAKHKGTKSYKQSMIDGAREYKAQKGKSAAAPEKKKSKRRRKKKAEN